MGQPCISEDTIVAIATPFGEGGLGVVRISGPQALLTADRIFQSHSPLSRAATHTLHHGWICEGPTKIDEAVASVFRSPSSYTGEDVIEFSCHGSPAVLQHVVRLCLKEGVRMAKPGEFTERAFLNGKIDLTQAEAVADLVRSRSDKSRRAALSQLEGQLHKKISEIRTPLIDLLSHLEANLDFVEEDIPPMPVNSALAKLALVHQKLQTLMETAARGRILREGLKVTIAGRPNVGKSSLFNALLSQDRAIVTDVPGTTRDTLEESVQWDGIFVQLVDTAGLRDSQDPVERLGHERAQQSLRSSDVQIVVVDGAEPLTSEDVKILSQQNSATTVVCINKSDRPQKWDQKTAPELRNFLCVATSATKETGLNELKISVLAKVNFDCKEADEASVAVNERHYQLLIAALAKLAEAEQAFQSRRTEESLGWDLREAVRSLDRILGTDVDADVLNSIFQTFCIGK